MDASAPKRLTVDWSGKRAEIEFDGGRVLSSVLSGAAAERQDEIGRSDYDPRTGEVTISFAWDERAVLDVGPDKEDGMPVVYLDQNHWVMLARLQWSPVKVKVNEHREAYERILDLARRRSISLPISSAHAFETARKDGRQRRELATTMLQLSRGRQMRSPLKIRREEILRSLAHFGSVPIGESRPPFTLDPDALFGSTEWPGDKSLLGDLQARLTWSSALAAMMTEDKREDDPDARAKGANWAAIYQEIGLAIAQAGGSREQKRDSAHAALIAENANDFASAAAMLGLNATAWHRWLIDSRAQMAAMPATGRVAEVTAQRLANPTHRWRVNDLSDIYYLASAAGYSPITCLRRRRPRTT
jgi:hypothetical protein